MIKVLHICSGFYNQQLYNYFFEELQKQNIKQFVFFPKRKWMINPDFKHLGYEGYSYTNHNIFLKIFYFLKIKLYTKALIKFFVDKNKSFNEYSLIHAHNLFVDGAIAYKLNTNYKVKYITAIRNADIKYLRYMPFLYFFGKKILNNSEQIICISPSIKTKILNKFKSIPNLNNKIIIIPNGINRIFLENTPLPKPMPNNPVKLLYIGSFLKRKNIHRIIDLINSNKNRYRLTIVGGGGNYEKKILDLINNNNNIKYFGVIKDKQQLINIYRQSDIFIMPSVDETFGLVYAEAMSQGTPVIYSKNTGFDHFFKDGEVGYAVNPNDIKDYAQKIQNIINNYNSISKIAIKRAKIFDWSKISKQYKELYINS